MARWRERADQILVVDGSGNVAFRQLVDIAKLRWRIERDYQELKQEVGLGHFEGRGWRGFHHHATLCIAAYGFLISERETIPPSTDRATGVFPQFALREGYQPRGSAVAARTPRSELDCNNATAIGGRSRHDAIALPMLRGSEQIPKFVTQ